MIALALYNCTPDASEDLEFKKNDIITNVEAVSDGWYRGTLPRTGQSGIFPANYVQIRDESPPALAPRPVVQAPSLPTRPDTGAQKQKPPVPSRSPSQTPSRSSTPVSTNTSVMASPMTIASPTINNNHSNLPCPSFILEKDFSKFVRMFDKEDIDQDGFLQANQVKPIFVMSQLPKDILARVWSLADFDGDGKLSKREFIIGMWLISCKVNDKVEVPQQLNKETQEWLTGGAPSNSLTTSMKGLRDNFSKVSNKDEPPIPPPTTKPLSAGSKGPSAFDAYKYSRTDEGKDLINTTAAFQQSKVGQQVTSAAWDHRDDIIKAAQSEQGKKAMKAAWDNKDAVAKGASSGMKFAMSLSK